MPPKETSITPKTKIELQMLYVIVPMVLAWGYVVFTQNQQAKDMAVLQAQVSEIPIIKTQVSEIRAYLIPNIISLRKK